MFILVDGALEGVKEADDRPGRVLHVPRRGESFGELTAGRRPSLGVIACCQRMRSCW